MTKRKRKHPSSKHQHPENIQEPSSEGAARTLHYGCWSLVLLWMLELGAWMFSCLQHLNKRFLRNIHRAERFHAFFAFFLFLEQLAFARNVAAVTFGGDVLAQ